MTPSPFHQTFGYYAHGVGPETATLPSGWEDRLVQVPVGGVRGFCLEIHDLALSKWAGGREKDREFVESAVRHGLVDRRTLLARLADMPLDAPRRTALREVIEAVCRR